MPVALLVGSILVVTTAWHGHLRPMQHSLWIVVLASSGIAFEYWLAAPANRIGSGVHSAAQLDATQEVVTLTMFSGFSAPCPGQGITGNHAIGFTPIAAGASSAFRSSGAPG